MQWEGMLMPAGYSATPLVRKLGIKPGFKMCVINPPDHYWQLLGDLPDYVSVRQLSEGSFDLIHFFTQDKAQLEARMSELRGCITPAGMIWVFWPKKASGVVSDVNENVVRDLALKNGLVDVKVAAVDDIWSGLKLVIRLRDR
jgi:hypothetical protein